MPVLGTSSQKASEWSKVNISPGATLRVGHLGKGSIKTNIQVPVAVATGILIV